MASFHTMLSERIRLTGSRLCVGLDPRPEGTPGEVREFLLRVVEETAPMAAAFKPNMAYFEAMGARGVALFEEIRAAVPEGIPVVLDGKRGDIGETQRYYARAAFDIWDVHAATVNPWLGFDSVRPFLEYEGRGVYLLAVTSNPGSADIQRQPLDAGFVYDRVIAFAERAREEGLPGTVGFVVGLTNAGPEVLEAVGEAPLLVPGLGAQGGDLAALAGRPPQVPDLVNVSRGILYRDPEKTFAEKARFYADQIAKNS